MGRPSLTTKMTLQTAVRSPDGAGGYSELWSDLGVLWGALERPRGAHVAGQEIPIARHRYRIIVRSAPEGAPSRPEVAQRFVFDGRAFHILGVTHEDSGRRFLACDVEEELVG